MTDNRIITGITRACVAYVNGIFIWRDTLITYQNSFAWKGIPINYKGETYEPPTSA